jgi:hypothetical protein
MFYSEYPFYHGHYWQTDWPSTLRNRETSKDSTDAFIEQAQFTDSSGKGSQNANCLSVYANEQPDRLLARPLTDKTIPQVTFNPPVQWQQGQPIPFVMLQKNGSRHVPYEFLTRSQSVQDTFQSRSQWFQTRSRCLLDTFPMSSWNVPNPFQTRSTCVPVAFPMGSRHVPDGFQTRFRCLPDMFSMCSWHVPMFQTHSQCVPDTFPCVPDTFR